MHKRFMNISLAVFLGGPLMIGCLESPTDPDAGKPSFSSTASDEAVSLGDTVKIEVSATGDPTPSYQWYKDGTKLDGETDSVLTIDFVAPSDTGDYHVEATNDKGSVADTMTLSFNPGKLFIMESDFSSGLLEWMDAGATSLSADNLSFHSDSRICPHGGSLYIVERFGADNVIKFDPSKTDKSGVLYQTHLGDNWNPQDIEIVSSTKAYVSNQNEPKISIINPGTGSVTGSIDIGSYTFNPDSNSSPYAGQMALADGNLYVLLQRRDGWNPGATTLILTIDVSTDAISSDTIACQYKNGYDMIYVDGALYVTNPGSSFSKGDGAIEKIVLSTKAVSTVIDETALGGNPNQIVHISGSRFYVQNYVGWKNVSVVEIDASSGSVVKTLPGITDAFGGICYDPVDSKLYVGERDSTNVGVRVFENNVQTAGPIKTSSTLPPSNLAMVR